MNSPGYHLNEITKGKYGELSKIKEEVLELEDAMSQGCKIMALVELSDLYGAIKGYLKREFPDTKMEDLEIMSAITERAFKNGKRY
jgi:hypothetical protein